MLGERQTYRSSRLAAVVLTALLGASLAYGCAAEARPTPSRRPATTAPTQAVATASPQLVATPSPVPVAAPIVDMFLSRFGQDQPPFHIYSRVDAVASLGADRERISIVVKGDISGQNFDGLVRMPAIGTAFVRFVDGTAYARIGGGRWVESPTFRQTQPLNPFTGVQASDFELVDTVGRGRRELHVLRSSAWMGGDLEMKGTSRIELKSTAFDVYVRGDGLPVRAVLDFSIEGATPRGSMTIDYHVEYRFSRVGKAVTIKAPALRR